MVGALCGDRRSNMDAEQTKVSKRGMATVLLVDDEREIRNYMRRVLEVHGYRVLDAGNGNEALELARQHSGPINLLLTDDVLPGMHGAEVIRQFRELRPGVPAVRMSGYPEHFGGYREEGVSYLEKPFLPEGLLERVRQVLDATPAAGFVSGIGVGAAAGLRGR
jgi:two-component system, cell cycle sensor histidine kinase and response regulator CckA